MKSLFKTSIFFILAAITVSCMENSKPNYQYMPDMYKTVSYEPYGSYDVFVDEQEAKLPVEGTVSRGWKPYAYEDTPEGYAAAKENLTNPLPYTEENLEQGKVLYGVYCAVCHGEKGDGQGILVEREKILGIPTYDDPGRAITEGSVYHVMYYGRNAMGSYASQTSIEERWLIDHYVMKLKNDLEGGPQRPFETVEEGDKIIPAVNAEEEIISNESSTSPKEENQMQE